jgi:hypothetical protein
MILVKLLFPVSFYISLFRGLRFGFSFFYASGYGLSEFSWGWCSF